MRSALPRATACSCQPADALVEAMGVVRDEEALHARPEDDQEAQVARRQLGLGEVVLRDLPADDDAGTEREPPEDGLGQGAADVVEVEVDAVGAELLQARVDVVGLVVDAGVVAVLVREIGEFLRAAGDPHRAAAGDLRELACDLADGAGRAGDHHGVARVRPPHVEEAEVGSQPGCAEHVQPRRRGRDAWVDLAQGTAARGRVLLPAELPDDQIAR